ncbi:alpha-amylase family glycosyl hydrolase [Streptomyces sp. NPDC017254]|uniref:alpha-amylase family glycosyl hydrolase n=1 Tax=unclassified Streptomyces TaxID=2593676 RepID=UPI0037A6B714
MATAVTAQLPASATHRTPPPPSDRALAAQPARHDLTREQFYFVLPDRFANGDTSNDRGGLTGSRTQTGYDPTDKGFYQGGDLKGLTGKLDYIKGLGTTAIWMAPIFKNKPVQGVGKDASAGYHGYWITDFTQVDPHFGTNEDLRKLIAAAHRKGMKVFFDVITNHTADVIRSGENAYGYRSTGAYPYLDSTGRPFEDTAVTPEVTGESFAYTPVVPEAERDVKKPAWLNDPAMYHNRGDSTFVGESGLHGDHTGLDDLWTERPEVVRGLAEIYQKWVEDFDIDGFRVDTVKNVDMAFWTRWATALDAYAAKRGREDFLIFGEVLSSDPSVTAPYVTRGRLDATLDFPLQQAVRGFASLSGPASDLGAVLAQDYRYTTDKANAYEQVTFLGNHDMGRMGGYLLKDNPDADGGELLGRARLANEVMFLTRGNPVVYAGDEQGFTGAGGDKDARQTLFASKVADYLDDDQLGTDRTHATDAYDTGHPLYRSITRLSRLTEEHPALRDGVQIERYADRGAGVYAYSRIDPRERTEHLVAVNNAAEPRTVTLTTGTARTLFAPLYGDTKALRSDGDRRVTVTVPALSAVVLKARNPIERPRTAPAVTTVAPAAGATGDVEISAEIKAGAGSEAAGRAGSGAGELNRVVFAAQVGNGPWQVLGSADHAPYKVTQHLSDQVREGTPLRYKAVLVDTRGRTTSDLASSTAGAPAAPGRPSAVDRDHAVVHYRRPDGDYTGWRLISGTATAGFTGRDAFGAFAWVKVDPTTGTVPYTVEKDGVTDGPPRTVELGRTGEVWIEQGGAGQSETVPDGVYPPQDGTKAVIHYYRPDGDYTGWGLHTWTGAATPTDWAKPLAPVRRDAFGAVYEVPLADGAASLSYIVHRGDEKDVPGDRSLEFGSHGKEVWLLGGATGYLLPGTRTAPDLDLSRSKATWLDGTTLVWDVKATDSTSQQLVYAPEGSITVEDGALSDEGRWLRLVPAVLTDEQRAGHPDLARHQAFTVDPRDRDRIPEALRGQLVATQRNTGGALLSATGVSTADPR